MKRPNLDPAELYCRSTRARPYDAYSYDEPRWITKIKDYKQRAGGKHIYGGSLCQYAKSAEQKSDL